MLVSKIGRLIIDDKNKEEESNPTILINKLLNDNSMLT